MKKILLFASCLMIVFSCGTPKQIASQPASTAPAAPEKPKYEELNGLAFAALSVINMRENPDYAAELGTQALMGTPVKVHHTDSYWVNVETPDGYKAWVNEMAIRTTTQEELSAWKKSKRLIVTTDYTFFLEAPKADARRVSDGVWGDIVQYSADAGEYVEVVLPSLKKAFVKAADVTDFKEWADSRKAVVSADASQEEIDRARQLILETAYKFIGVPYLWAGTSIKGVDCSGFSKTVYYLNGYMLLRNASQQYKTGEPVDISQGYDNLRPGDLIFFGREATKERKERITHVGIYIGDGIFIHSAQLVRINSLIKGAPNEYSRKPIRACRIIGNQDCGKNVWSIAKSDVYFENN